MMELTVRPYAPGDRSHVIELWSNVFPDDPQWNDPATIIDRKQNVQPELFLVGEWDGAVVAAVVAGFDGFRGWVYHLATSSSHRRRGFASQLIAEVEHRLAELGCPKLNLQVRATNAVVIEFYKRLGYSVEERVDFSKLLNSRPDDRS